MGIKKGDKFIIEITEETEQWAGYYFVSNNTTYFHISEEELECLERYDETEAYKKGYAKAMEDIQEAVRVFRVMNNEDRKRYFDGKYTTAAILDTFDPREIVEKLKAYEKEQSKIKVGDEIDIDDIKAVVTCVDEENDRVFVLYVDGYIDEIEGIDENVKLAKTGRHFDEVESLLKILKNMTGGEDSEQIQF